MFPRTRIALKKNDGFSLVELMIVVAIIGILAGLAVPKFNLFQAKARQAEVKTNLSSLYTLQQSYFGDNDEYVEFSDLSSTNNCAGAEAIGFTPSPCSKMRYTYSSKFGAEAKTTFIATGFTAVKRIYPGCSATTNDTWTIDQGKDLLNTEKGLTKCGGG